MWNLSGFLKSEKDDQSHALGGTKQQPNVGDQDRQSAVVTGPKRWKEGGI